MKKYKTAVVIPCYKVSSHILKVIEGIGPEVQKIYVVDDCCPENSGELVKNNSRDKRVEIIYHSENRGVGGAVISGYKKALTDEMDVIVKIDGDGQMDTSRIKDLIAPIISGSADYTKGNRFHELSDLESMPKLRLIGNAFLALTTKFSSGYWTIFDPTNGFTAISTEALRKLDLNKINERYFFESDMLFRLNLIKAVVKDVAMPAQYGGEISNLKIINTLWKFPLLNLRNFLKRIFYTYYLRDMSPASIQFFFGNILFAFGVIFGGYHWYRNSHSHIPTPLGTIMLSTITIILGVQFLIGWITQDMNSVPSSPLTRWR